MPITLGLLALALIGTQALTLGYMSKTVAYPVCIGIAALIGFSGLVSFPLSKRRMAWLFAVLGAVFVVKWRVMPLAVPGGAPIFPADYAAMHALAQYLLLAQVLICFVITRPASGRQWDLLSLPLCGVVVMAGAADYIAQKGEHRAFLVLSLVFSALFALYYAAVRGPALGVRRGFVRYAVSGLVLLVALAAGAGMSVGLSGNIQELDRLLFSFAEPFIPGRGTGFSGQAKLDSIRNWKSQGGAKPMLRVESATAPGYLRACAFEKYTGKEWVKPKGSDTLKPTRHLPEGVTRKAGNTFVLRERLHAPWHTMDVWPDASIRQAAFMPVDTACVQVPVAAVIGDENHCVTIRDMPADKPYRVTASSGPVDDAPSDDMRARYTAVPPDVASEVRALADGIMEGRDTPSAKIAAVEAYFHDNYDYTLGIEIPAGRDPLVHFLLEKPAAHCEYFASGAAILLRLGGVPCRYVTGFVVWEENRYGGYWLARSRHAHAWVEAWDDALGWTVVEATPAAGLIESQRTSALGSLFDYARFLTRKLVALFRDKGVAALRTIAAALFKAVVFTTPGRIALALFAITLIARRLARLKRKPRETVTPEVTALRGLLKEMDRRAKKRGLHRRPNETLDQFATRILDAGTGDAWHEHAASWYRHYTHVRYGAQTDADALDVLRQTMGDW